MTTETLFTELEGITNETIDFMEKSVESLSNEQLSWKPRQEMWNVKEIVAHVLEFAKYYNSAFAKKIDTTQFREPRETFVSSPLGKSMWSAMKLGNAKNIKRKMKSSKMYNPLIVKSIVTDSILAEFVASQRDLLDIMKRARTINIRKAKIKLATQTVIKFRFGDTLLYVVYHNQRHMQQLLNLLNHPKFPK